MSEKLENLVANGEKVVETQEERVERLKQEQERDKQLKAAREQMKQRHDALKTMIPFLETELRYNNLQNEITKSQIERYHLAKQTEEIQEFLKQESDNSIEDVENPTTEG